MTLALARHHALTCEQIERMAPPVSDAYLDRAVWRASLPISVEYGKYDGTFGLSAPHNYISATGWREATRCYLRLCAELAFSAAALESLRAIPTADLPGVETPSTPGAPSPVSA